MEALRRSIVTSVPRCADVISPQDTPTSFTMRVCTTGVRSQTSVP